MGARGGKGWVGDVGRVVSWWWSEDRRPHLRAVLPPDYGVVVVKALQACHKSAGVVERTKIARAVKEEIVEALAKELGDNEKQANQLLNKLQRIGKFSIEAWS